jgi:hypothetical protein
MGEVAATQFRSKHPEVSDEAVKANEIHVQLSIADLRHCLIEGDNLSIIGG